MRRASSMIPVVASVPPFDERAVSK